MSIYNLRNTSSDAKLQLTERSIYGSSRVGTENPENFFVASASGMPSAQERNQKVGDKRYELANHLGNVLEVITDRKVSQSGTASTLIKDDFATGVDNWIACGGAASIESENGRLKVNTLPASNQCAYKFVDYVEGETYRLNVKIDEGTTPNGVELEVFGVGVFPLSQGANTIDYIVTGNVNTVIIKPTGAIGNYVYYIDDVSLERITFTTDGTTPVADYYADIVSQSDYYPFGMLLPNRNDQGNGDYRYAFNGMEADDEVTGRDKQSYDFGARFYNPRVGRWLSRDPLEKGYPESSTYCFAGSNPILFADEGGKYKVPKNVREQYPFFSALIDNIYEVPLNNTGVAENLQKYGSYHDLEDIRSVYGKDQGPTLNVNKILGDAETGYVNDDVTYTKDNIDPNTSVDEVYSAINVRWVKQYEKLGNKLNDDGLSDKKREKLTEKFNEATVFLTSTILHEGVHVGDYLKHGYMSGIDAEGNEHNAYVSNNPMQEIGAHFEFDSGYTNSSGYLKGSGEIFEQTLNYVKVDEILYGPENKPSGNNDSGGSENE